MSVYFRNFIYLSTCILLLGACKTSKKALSSNLRSDTEIKSALAKHNIKYDWFTAVGKIRLSTPDESIGAKVYLRIQRDSAIWMVVKKIGIEVARVLITPEEFTIIYRWEKVYEQESLKTLMDSYNASLSFTELQDYIIGNIPVIDSSNFTTRQTASEIICQTNIMGHKSFLKLDQNNLQLLSFEIFNTKNESAKGDFEDFKSIGEYTVPYKRSFYISSLEHGDLMAILDITELQINEPKSIKFSVPPHYERLKYYRPF